MAPITGVVNPINTNKISTNDKQKKNISCFSASGVLKNKSAKIKQAKNAVFSSAENNDRKLLTSQIKGLANELKKATGEFFMMLHKLGSR